MFENSSIQKRTGRIVFAVIYIPWAQTEPGLSLFFSSANQLSRNVKFQHIAVGNSRYKGEYIIKKETDFGKSRDKWARSELSSLRGNLNKIPPSIR